MLIHARISRTLLIKARPRRSSIEPTRLYFGSSSNVCEGIIWPPEVTRENGCAYNDERRASRCVTRGHQSNQRNRE